MTVRGKRIHQTYLKRRKKRHKPKYQSVLAKVKRSRRMRGHQF